MMIYCNAIWIAVDIEFNEAEFVFEAQAVFLLMEVAWQK